MADPHAELELAQRYAVGALGPAEAEVFEAHLLTCQQCQDEVRLTVGLRRVVRETPASRRNVAWLAGAATLLAAAIVVFAVVPSGATRRLADLGRVAEPPAYLGLSVRDLPGRADSLFASAMTAYAARRYVDAAADLRAALAAGVDTIPATFFLASAELMAGHPRVALDAYARIIAAGPAAAAYLPEAHLYSAHALLQLGRGDDALAALSSVSRESERGAAAAALADSVTRVLRR